MVGSGGATLRLCQAVRRAGCHCLVTAVGGAPRSDVGVQMFPPMFAVRVRFDFARQALRRGLAASILMHDADVFFRRGGLLAMARLVRSLPHVDFALSDNGPRRSEAFEDLNWGLAWISGSATSLSLLDCALAEWNHPAFDRPSDRPASFAAFYFSRSQPRLNHILESAIAANGRIAPRVCTFVRRDQDKALRHMTGMAGAHAKLICARAENVSRLPEPWGKGCVLAYTPPLDATPRAACCARRGASAALRPQMHAGAARPSSSWDVLRALRSEYRALGGRRRADGGAASGNDLA